MRLLVSVRSAEEVEAALAGGADIVDAKEPTNGPLGPVSAVTLAEISRRVPANRQLSAALGDVATEEDVVAALAVTEGLSRHEPAFLKLGFAGLRSQELVSTLLTTAVRLTSMRRWPLHIIAVAYADTSRAESLPPHLFCRLAHQAGAAGVLMDTYAKDGKKLLDWWSPALLADWITEARGLGLLTGLAGALGAEDAAGLAPANPDVIGFRGAACDSGRSGRVSAQRVALLRSRVDRTGRTLVRSA